MIRSVRRSTRWLRLLTLFMAIGLIAAACGGSDGESSTPDDKPDSGQGSNNQGGDVTGTAALGGSVNYGLEAETSGGFCLQEAQLAASGIQVAKSIYDTLTAPNGDGEITPFLAESFEPNDDFTEWTFTLREGVKFHDGTALDATVVKNNIDAYRGQYKDAAGEKIRSPLLFEFVFQDIESVEVIDDLNVTVTTKRPWVAFPWAMWGSSRVGITAQAQLDSADDCGNLLIGTGPFRLDSPGDRVVGEQTKLVRNDDYWQTDENGIQLPYLDSITYKVIPEGAQRISALQTDEVDIMHTSGTEDIALRLQPLADEGNINLTVRDSFGEVNYLMLNVTKPPFDNKNARLAFAHGLDRELLDEVRGAGIGTVADGPFQADVLGHLDDTGFPQFDQELAREFAAAYEADTGEPLAFTYSFVAGEAGQLTAQEIQGQLAEVDIDITPVPIADQATSINVAIAKDFQALGWRNHPGADPDTQYNWWYTGSLVNFSGIDDPTVNELLDTGRTNPDPAVRKQAYEDLNRRFGEEVYNLWTTFSQWGIATDPEIQNVFGYDLPGGGPAFEGLGTGHLVAGLFINTSDG